MTNLSLLNKAAGAALTLAVAAASAACSSSSSEGGRIIAQVGDATLTAAEVTAVTPSGLSEADSLAFTDAYVNTWISDMLITEEAVKHLPSTEEIDRKTEEYRRQLIMWEYRNLVVASDTSLAVSEADLLAYYDQHSAELKLTEPLVRGIYIKIESSAPMLADVKKLYKSSKRNDIDRLEKVGLRGAIHYDYFRDRWIPWSQIITKIPREIPVADLRPGYSLDFEADGFTYLLSVSELLPAGGVTPYEAAKPRIREIVSALRRNELDSRLRSRLRQQAEANGTLIDHRHSSAI